MHSQTVTENVHSRQLATLTRMKTHLGKNLKLRRRHGTVRITVACVLAQNKC